MSPAFITLPDIAPNRLDVCGIGTSLATAFPRLVMTSARMARHYDRSPELLAPAQIEAYMLHLVKDRKLSYSSVNHTASASRFLFEVMKAL